MTDRERDELFVRLRDADPSSSLPPADPAGVARLLEDAMSHDTMTETRGTGTRGRSPLTWLVAAAAVALIVAAGVFALLPRGGDQPSVASPDPTASDPTASEPTVTELTMPAAAAGRCMVPTAQMLGSAAYAFDGTVTGIDAGVVTLEVDRWYAGGESDLVQVDQASADLNALTLAPIFEAGGRFLVAGTEDGSVMVCGFSGPYTAELADLYTKAFAA
ncbi:hypothetical protein [Nocardioides sp.]|uniref:hypothetical protein n=1 Tax=Nocardioides sp. TaxID=35761 RepID=UPI002ED12DDF